MRWFIAQFSPARRRAQAAYEQLISRAQLFGWVSGLIVGVAAGMAFTMLFLPFVLRFKVDPLLAGIAFNLFALALCRGLPASV